MEGAFSICNEQIEANNITIASGVLTPICNKWLEKGVYFIGTNLRLTLPAACQIEQFISVDGIQDAAGSSANNLEAGFQSNNIGFIIEVKQTSANVVFQARQYSGSPLEITGWMFVTKLK